MTTTPPREQLPLSNQAQSLKHAETLHRMSLNAFSDAEAALKAGIEALRAQAASVEAVTARPMATAPRDGSIIRLLVEFDDHSLEDDDKPQWTIGGNSLKNTREDVWQFAGWSWTQDRFTEGDGVPIGWLPLLDDAPPTPAHIPASVEALSDEYVRAGYRERDASGRMDGHTKWQVWRDAVTWCQEVVHPPQAPQAVGEIDEGALWSLMRDVLKCGEDLAERHRTDGREVLSAHMDGCAADFARQVVSIATKGERS